MFLNVSKKKNDTITEKYRGEEKRIYQELHEYNFRRRVFIEYVFTK